MISNQLITSPTKISQINSHSYCFLNAFSHFIGRQVPYQVKRAHVLPIITWPLGDTLAVDDAIDTPHEDIFVIPDSWDFTFEFPPNWSDTNNIQLHSTAYDSTQTRRRKESPMKKTNSTF